MKDQDICPKTYHCFMANLRQIDCYHLPNRYLAWKRHSPPSKHASMIFFMLRFIWFWCLKDWANGLERDTVSPRCFWTAIGLRLDIQQRISQTYSQKADLQTAFLGNTLPLSIRTESSNQLIINILSKSKPNKRCSEYCLLDSDTPELVWIVPSVDTKAWREQSGRKNRFR